MPRIVVEFGRDRSIFDDAGHPLKVRSGGGTDPIRSREDGRPLHGPFSWHRSVVMVSGPCDDPILASRVPSASQRASSGRIRSRRGASADPLQELRGRVRASDEGGAVTKARSTADSPSAAAPSAELGTSPSSRSTRRNSIRSEQIEGALKRAGAAPSGRKACRVELTKFPSAAVSRHDCRFRAVANRLLGSNCRERTCPDTTPGSEPACESARQSGEP